MHIKRFITLFKRRVPKIRTRIQATQEIPLSKFDGSISTKNISHTSSRFLTTAEIGREVPDYDNSDFAFIKDSNSCHLLSLDEPEMFDLDEIEECRSVNYGSHFNLSGI